MTPNDLEILIHYYTRCEDHERLTAPAVRETVARYLGEGIFREGGNGFYRSYSLTEKGEKWLQMILDTPAPISVWLDPREVSE